MLAWQFREIPLLRLQITQKAAANLNILNTFPQFLPHVYSMRRDCIIFQNSLIVTENFIYHY